jgi:glucose/arabinose dehydrogenase
MISTHHQKTVLPGRGGVRRICSWIAILLVQVLSLCASSLPNGFSEFLVASGISSPTAMEFAPDGRLFVCQQNGQLRVIKNMTLLTTPFLTVSTTSSGERGLLGIAFDPGFTTNNFLYLYYTATSPATHNRVSRFTANGDVVLAGSEVPILDLENLGASNHNGGAIHFGVDGKLYIAVGENAVTSNAQSLSNRLGKILRINPDGSIPTDNPFYNVTTPARRSIWALGLRNPYTFAVQPGTGRIFINDVGAQDWEEINEGVPGANYGWPNCEGRCTPANPSYRDPLFQYGHGSNATNGCDITGGTFYNPIAFQYPGAYRGTYFFADACGGWIRRLNPTNGAAFNFGTSMPGPVDLKVSAEGRLFYLSRGDGSVWAIDYTNAPPALGVTRQGASVMILWPAPSTGYVLQTTASLGPGAAWSAVPGVITTNGQKRVLLSPGPQPGFYRLAKP